MHTVDTTVEDRTVEIPETDKGVGTIETTIKTNGVEASEMINTSAALIATGPVQIMQRVSGWLMPVSRLRAYKRANGTLEVLYLTPEESLERI